MIPVVPVDVIKNKNERTLLPCGWVPTEDTLIFEIALFEEPPLEIGRASVGTVLDQDVLEELLLRRRSSRFPFPVSLSCPVGCDESKPFNCQMDSLVVGPRHFQSNGPKNLCDRVALPNCLDELLVCPLSSHATRLTQADLQVNGIASLQVGAREGT